MLSLPSRLLAAATATAAIACAGCGNPATVSVPGSALRLGVSEYRISPQNVRITAGRVVIEVHDAGTIAHRLRIATASGIQIATSPALRPGQSAQVVVHLAPGHYATSDPLGNHATLGARGTLVVR